METNNNDSKLMNELKTIANVTSGNQRKFYDYMLANAKDVKLVPLSEIFSRRDIKMIKAYVQPEPKMCYRNAHLLTNIIPDLLYVEGRITCCGEFGIDHAWNRIGDKYIDITMELALKRKVSDEEYLSLGEYKRETITRITSKTEFYGNIQRELFIEENELCNIK